jgi:hypothetical protein
LQETGSHATDIRRGDLHEVDRRDGNGLTHSHSCDQTADDQSCEIGRRCGNDGPDKREDAADEESILSRNPVGDVATC